MIVNLSTITTSILSASAALVVFMLLYRKPLGRDRLGLYSPIVVAGAIALRILLPFECGFTRTILLPGFYSRAMDWLNWPLWAMGESEVTVYHALVLLSLSVFAVKLFHLLRMQAIYGQHVQSLLTDSILSYKDMFGHSRTVRCVLDPSSTNALAFGLLKPTIVLPKLPLTASERQMIIQHELIHIKNGDLWIKYMVEIVCIFFWWNPLFSWLKTQVSNTLETRVDQCVVQDLSDVQKIEYVECLLKMVKSKMTNVPAFSTYFVNDKDATIRQRFKLILSSDTIRTLSRFFVVIMLAVMIGSVFIVFEPYYMPDEIKNTTFAAPDSRTSYLVKRADGEYDLYMNGVFASKALYPSSFEGLRVYNSLEEVVK